MIVREDLVPLSLSMPVSAPPAEALRQEFLLDPDVVFLNHGSFGATPEPVFAEYGRWQRELERQPVEFLGRRARGLAGRGARRDGRLSRLRARRSGLRAERDDRHQRRGQIAPARAWR